MRSYKDIQARNSGLTARLPLLVTSIDARALIAILIVVFHISWTSFFIFLATLIFFSVLEYLGYGVPVAARRARALIAGKNRFVNKASRRRRRLIHD